MGVFHAMFLRVFSDSQIKLINSLSKTPFNKTDLNNVNTSLELNKTLPNNVSEILQTA